MTMTKSSTKIILGFVTTIFLIASVFIAQQFVSKSQQSEQLRDQSSQITENQEKVNAPEDSESAIEITLVAEQDNTNAYELLTQTHEVVSDEYDFGVFVVGIDGITADEEYYWAFYVNDEYASAGVQETVLQAGDSMSFRFEKIEFGL